MNLGPYCVCEKLFSHFNIRSKLNVPIFASAQIIESYMEEYLKKDFGSVVAEF